MYEDEGMNQENADKADENLSFSAGTGLLFDNS